MTKFVIYALLLSLSARATHCFVSPPTAATFLLPKRHSQPSHQHRPDVVTLLQATQGADDAKNASEISREEIADYRRGIASSDSNGGKKVHVRTILQMLMLCYR